MASRAALAVAMACAGAASAGETQASLGASPAQVLLGRDKSVTLTLIAPERTTPMSIAATAGTVGALAPAGRGRWKATLQPPLAHFPQVSIVAAWDPDDPEVAPIFLAVPMAAQETLSFTVVPSARVTLAVAGERYGPYRADAQGRVEVPARLWPGVSEGTLSVAGSPDRPVPLPAPPFPRTAMVVAPGTIHADGKSRAEIWVFAVDAAGRPLPGARISVRSSLGRVGPVREVGDGVYQATFTAPVRLSAASAALSVALGDEPPRAQATVELRAGVKANLSLKLSRGELLADGEAQAVVTATLTGEGGARLAGQEVSIGAAHGAVSPAVDKGDGTYLATYTAPAGQHTGDVVTARTAGGAAAKAEIALAPPPLLAVAVEPPSLVADGRAQARVRLTVRGPDGRLAPDGTPISLAAEGGSIEPEARSQGGRAAATFTAGQKSGPGRITAAVGSMRASADLALLAGPPVRLLLSAERTVLRSDGVDQVQVTALVYDALGNPVPGARPSLVASVGAVEAGLAEVAPGRFQTIYVAPSQRFGGEVELRAQGPGDLAERIALTLVAPPPLVRLALGGVLGHNLGALAAGGGLAEAAVRLHEDRLYAVLDAGLALGSADVDCPPPLSCKGTQSVRVVPARLGAYWRFANGSVVTPYLGGGAGVYLAQTRVEVQGVGAQAEDLVVPGAYGRLGLELAIGPGAGFAEVRYDYARAESVVAAGTVGGLAAATGYRLGL